MKWNNLGAYRDRLTQMKELTPHEILGVDTSATKQDVRDAYIKLIKAYHPDQSDAFMRRYNQEMAKLINSAYKKVCEDK